MSYTFENATINNVSDDGKNYLYSLACDYESYVNDFGIISLQEFIRGWTCIPRKAFESLREGDYFYTPNGQQYKAIDECYESDDEVTLYIECVAIKEDGSEDTSSEVLNNGDIYSAPYVHKDYAWKTKRKMKGDKLCPILITNQVQHQN